jgi:hypothetical protein
MSSARRLALGLAVLAPMALGGCLGVETTQQKSAKKAKTAGRRLASKKGLTITRSNLAVKVEQSAIVQDPNGVAAVVRVKNTGATQVTLPVAITVSDAHGKKLYANDIPGLDPSLVSLSVLGAGQEAYWVNNQILVAGKAGKLDARVGAAKGTAKGALPRITLSAITSGRDADGPYAKGIVRNESSLTQRRLTISCVARQGTAIRAAGRAVIDSLPPSAGKKPTAFTVFFIGDPKGASLACAAPPTVLPGGTS